jgi:hypothetical protein
MWFVLIASMVMQVAAQRQQAKAQAQEAEFQRQEALANAARAKADAELSERIAEAESVEAAMEAERLAGRRKVLQAAGGGRTDVGTNLLIRIQDADMAEWEQTKAALGARHRTGALRAESMGFTRQAFQYGVRKSNIRTASRYRQAGTIIGGLGQAYTLGGGFRTTSPNYSTLYSNAGVTPSSSVITGNRFGSP